MKVPYSLLEAEILRSEFQNLVGTFSDNIAATVEAVVITPFDQPSKQRYFLFYHLFDNDAQAALTHEYTGFFFDVVIVAKDSNGSFVYEDLNSWFMKNNYESEYPACPLPMGNNSAMYA